MGLMSEEKKKTEKKKEEKGKVKQTMSFLMDFFHEWCLLLEFQYSLY
jgi:hypothetical protein